MQMNPDELIGRGLAWPLEIDANGSLKLIGGVEVLDQSLRTILGTAKGERVMRPAFGCAIWDMVFDPVTTNSLGLMEHAVRDAIGQWEPRVTVEDVVATPSERGAPGGGGAVDIAITYIVRATNDRRNLVYPFYVIPGEGQRR